MILPEFLQRTTALHSYPLLFATISGAHLYGFPSPDSDYDLRGAHILPLGEVVGLEVFNETVEQSSVIDQIELDLVTHDVKKFFSMLLKKNGYVLEQLFSPLVVHTSAEHDELKEIALGCITKNHSHHYLGFAASQWKLVNSSHPPRVKPLLYVYRVLLTGIHLMQTGEVQANLLKLNEQFHLPYIYDLVMRKLSGSEKQPLGDLKELELYEKEYIRLRLLLEQTAETSSLPELSSSKAALNDLLIRLRLKTSQ